MHGPTPSPPVAIATIKPAPPGRLLALLIAMSAIGPLSLNILMPAVPGLVTRFDTHIETVQLTLSLYLIGMAASQLVLGPLSDRFGRRPVVLGGLALTVLASVAALAASDIWSLIAARTVQALGASSGLVIGRAIIRDLYERDRAASMIGWVTAAVVVAPMVAPSIGGVLDTLIGWQAIFAVVALAAAAVLLWGLRALPETRTVRVSEGGLLRFLQDTRLLLTSMSFIGYVLCSAFGSALFFAFLGGAPHAIVTQMGRSSAEFGLWFAFGALGYMAGNYGAARWSPRLGTDAMVRLGIVIGLVGAIAAVAFILAVPHWGPAAIFLPQIVMAVANGLMLPNAIAGAISVRPQAAGTASGITGFLQMAVGAAGAQYVSHLLADSATAIPMALVLLAFAVAAALSYVVFVRRR